MWIGFSTFLVNYMGFAIKNNSAISLVLSEFSQCSMGRSRSADQCKHHSKHNRLGNMGYQGLLGVQMVRYAPFDNGIDKGKMWAWTLNEINFEIRRQSLPNLISEIN